MRLCGYTVVRFYGYAVLRLCGFAVVWLYGCKVLRLCCYGFIQSEVMMRIKKSVAFCHSGLRPGIQCKVLSCILCSFTGFRV